MLLTDLLDFSFKHYGEYPFLYFNNTTYTNKETSVFSKKISVLLRNLGICDGERVIVSLPNCPEVIFSYQGILRAKNVVVPVMFLLHPSEIHFILNDCKAKAIVTSSLVLPKLVEAAKNLPYEPIFIVVDQIPNIKDYENVDIVELHKAIELINEDEEEAMHASESDLAVILYTSGTTGRPKGVMLTHKNLYSSARTSYEMSIENGDYEPSTTIGVLPLAHIYGFTTMNTNFLLGNSVDIFPTFDVEKLFQSIEKYKVKNIGLVPAMIHAMVFAPQSNKYDLSSLESVISGSASLPVALIQAFKKKFGEFKNVVSSENNIHEFVYVPYLLSFFFFLHHTATHGNDHIRILLFVGFQGAKATVYPHIGILPHCTGIIINEIGIFAFCRNITNLFQNSI